MAEYLVVRLNEDAAKPAQWIAVDDTGTRRSPPVIGPLEKAVQDIGERTVIVLVPASATLSTSVDIPVRAGSRMLAALPYALEEQLADDVDTLHFAAGSRRASGRVPVVVVSHTQMQEWLARLKFAGIHPARIIPENFGLARIPGSLSLLAAEEQIMFNDGADTDFIMQGVKPSDALAAAGIFDKEEEIQESEDNVTSPTRHLLVYCEAADEQLFEQDWAALRHELASVDIHLLPDGVLPRLAITVGAGAGVNLLQGAYGAKTDMTAAFRPWRYVAILLVALGVVGLAGKAVDNVRLKQDRAALQEQFAQEYREIRPNDTQKIVDPMATVNSVRRSLGAPEAP